MAKKKPNAKVSKKATVKPKPANKVAGNKKAAPKKKVVPAKKAAAKKPVAAKKKASPAKKAMPAKKEAVKAKKKTNPVKPVKANKTAPKKTTPVKKEVIVKKIAKVIKKEIPKIANLAKKELPKPSAEKIIKEKPSKIDKKAKKPLDYVPRPIAPVMDQTIAKNYTPPISRPSLNQPVINRPVTPPPAERKPTPDDDKLLAIKKDVLSKCLEFQTSFINTAKKAMDEAQESANEEKGSNEEKFDSFRETMQIARDMHARQLAEGIDGLALLKRIMIAPLVDHVKLGSIVCTNLQNYFISASLGVIESSGKNYMAISTMTPLYQALAGKQKGDKFSFRNTEYKILEVF